MDRSRSNMTPRAAATDDQPVIATASAFSMKGPARAPTAELGGNWPVRLTGW
ncbi:hypothetical protein AIOL_001212 [Candidatus Rhodobacter oscarellae]|uniref:Uncharacterized protein n=1 Tax=Candidatus Rhodobacter oscarellae TaxID=1675527 RepID=A0A0J9E0K9_9RHOB|nr:hypothetical protein [Candidatus Rhodobacter lobularis]KMW56260.1 hypothetical protein AIOL_001212 [Candidatus Rhodobacter lobularis]